MTTVLILQLSVLLLNDSLQGQILRGPDKANEAAQSLLGRSPDVIAVHRSPVDHNNYLSFSGCSQPEDSKTCKIWLYETYDGTYKELWSHRFGGGGHFTRIKFANLEGEQRPSVCFEWVTGGSGGSVTVLGLYSIQRNRLSLIEFTEDRSATPSPRLEENDNDAPDPTVRMVLRSWAEELGIIGKKSLPANLRDPEQMEEAWVNDNGHILDGTVKLRYYRSLPASYLSSFKSTAGTPTKEFTVQVSDSRYAWASFFKAGVVGYDKRTRQYFMIYLPPNRYDYVRNLAVREPWVYMSSDCFNRRVFSDSHYRSTIEDRTWTFRFNKQTHVLEHGRFDSLVRGGTLPRNVRPSGDAGAGPRDFWTTEEDKLFRAGAFPAIVENRSRLEFLLLRGKGFNCVFGRYADGCWSGSGSIMLSTDKNKGTTALEVIGHSSSQQYEETFSTLSQIALLLIDHSEWHEEVKLGMAKLKVTYDAARLSPLRDFDLYHYGQSYSLHLIVMDREAFKLVAMAMAIEGGQKWQDEQIADCKYWILSVRPRRQ